jgi:hypothetical protein
MRKWRVIVFPAHTHHPQAADDATAIRNSTAREMTGLNRNGQISLRLMRRGPDLRIYRSEHEIRALAHIT